MGEKSGLASSMGDTLNYVGNLTAAHGIAFPSQATGARLSFLLHVHELVNHSRGPAYAILGIVLLMLPVAAIVCWIPFNNSSGEKSVLQPWPIEKLWPIGKPQPQSEKRVQFLRTAQSEWSPPASQVIASSHQDGDPGAASNHLPHSKDPYPLFHAYPPASNVTCPPVSNLTLLDARRRHGPGAPS